MLEVELKRRLPGFNLDISFSIDGEVLGILGPSGSGKTMTLQCIAGLVRPDQGSIKLNGRVLFDSSKRVNLPARVRNVGLVYQNYSLFPHLSAAENIAYGIHNRPRSEADERVRLLVRKMRLSGLEDRRPRQLSAGQQQRVAMARALAPEPEVLLLDEPFSALDSLTKEHLQLEIMEVQEFYKGSIILVTHDLAEAYRLSSRLAVYEGGKILQCGPKELIVSSPANRKVARMMGMRNCLDGFIAEVGDSDVWVTISGLDTRLRVATNNHKSLTANQPVAVGVYPQYVRVAEGPGQNTFLGSLDRMADAITSVHCRFRLDGRPGETAYVEAVFPNSGVQSLSNGEQYYVHLPPEHVTIIDTQ